MQKVKDFIQGIWLSLSDSTRDHIISAVRVFGSVFAATLLVAVKSGVEWTWAFWASLFTVSLSAGLKAMIQNFAPPSLGGKRK